MYKAKKFLCVVLAALLVCMAAACGKKNSEPTEAETTEQTEPETTEFTFPDETGFYAQGGVFEEMEISDDNVTEATEPKETETTATESTETTTAPTTAPTDPTEEEEPENPTTEPTTEATEPENTQPSSGMTEYERYIAMSPAEQAAFYATFPSPEAFTAWYHNAMAEYENQKNSVDVGDGVVDLEKFT